MKTIKKQTVIENKPTNEYKRVGDEEAAQLVKDYGWLYCKKMEWKENVRGFSKPKVEKKKEPIKKVESKQETPKAPPKEKAPKVISEEAKKLLEKTAPPKTARQERKAAKAN